MKIFRGNDNNFFSSFDKFLWVIKKLVAWVRTRTCKEAKLFDQHRVLKHNKWPRPRFFQGGGLISDPAVVERARSPDLLGIVSNLFYIEFFGEIIL